MNEQKNFGTVVQVIGPVLDVKFADGQLPNLLNAPSECSQVTVIL